MAGGPSATPRGDETAPRAGPGGLGAALRRAWIGYQRRLDEAMAAAGFDDRRFPDGRVLRMCADHGGRTISQIGRELGITRQGAGKVVAGLRDRRYVTVRPSPTDGREKVVTLSARAVDYLAAQRTARRAIERQLQTELGADAVAGLFRMLEALGGDDQPRMSVYLREMRQRGSRRYPED